MFGWQIARVDGDSMTPSLGDGDYVLARKNAVAVPGDIALIRHHSLGLIVKRVKARDEDGCCVVAGDNPASTSSDVLGAIEPDAIAGVVRWHVSPGGLLRLRRGAV